MKIKKYKKHITIILILVFISLIVNLALIKDLIIFIILCGILYLFFFTEGFGHGND